MVLPVVSEHRVGRGSCPLEDSSAAGCGVRMARAGEPSVRRGEQTDGAGGDGGLPGDERPHVGVWRGGRDGDGAASRRRSHEGRREGSVGGEKCGARWASEGQFTTEALRHRGSEAKEGDCGFARMSADRGRAISNW